MFNLQVTRNCLVKGKHTPAGTILDNANSTEDDRRAVNAAGKGVWIKVGAKPDPIYDETDDADELDDAFDPVDADPKPAKKRGRPKANA